MNTPTQTPANAAGSRLSPNRKVPYVDTFTLNKVTFYLAEMSAETKQMDAYFSDRLKKELGLYDWARRKVMAEFYRSEQNEEVSFDGTPINRENADHIAWAEDQIIEVAESMLANQQFAVKPELAMKFHALAEERLNQVLGVTEDPVGPTEGLVDWNRSDVCSGEAVKSLDRATKVAICGRITSLSLFGISDDNFRRMGK